MISLIIKDFLVQKKFLKLSFAYILLMIFAFSGTNGEAMFVSGVVMITYVLTQSACAYDDKNNTGIMMNSLPVSKSSIVLSRYISAFLFFLLGVAEYFILNLAADMLKLPVKIYPITAEGLVGAFAAVLVIHALYFPIVFKIGYMRAKYMNMIIFFAVFLSISGFVYLVRQTVNLQFVNKIVKIIAASPDIVTGILLAVAATVILLISFSLSLRFYKRREF